MAILKRKPKKKSSRKVPSKRGIRRVLATLTLLSAFITSNPTRAEDLTQKETVEQTSFNRQTQVTIRELSRLIKEDSSPYQNGLNNRLRVLGLQISHDIEYLTPDKAKELYDIYKGLIAEYEATFKVSFDSKIDFKPRTTNIHGIERSIELNMTNLRGMLRQIEKGKKTKAQLKILVNQEVLTIIDRLDKLENTGYRLPTYEKVSIILLKKRIDRLLQEAIHHYGESIISKDTQVIIKTALKSKAR